VNAVRRAFGDGSGFSRTTELMILNPELCNANPMLKMKWYVPLTQIVPSGLGTRRASPTHRSLNAWSFSKEPSERPQALYLRIPDARS
jgi:hypothetical protein